MSSLLLEQATAADTAILASIHASAFPLVDAWSENIFDLQLMMPNVFGLLHRQGGFILTRVVADEAEILTLAVRPEIRRRGVASILLNEATKLVAAVGATMVFLEVSAVNIAAQQLYRKVGFIQAGCRRHYYSDRSDALVLRLDLAAFV